MPLWSRLCSSHQVSSEGRIHWQKQGRSRSLDVERRARHPPPFDRFAIASVRISRALGSMPAHRSP
jgi:hypothetical protein